MPTPPLPALIIRPAGRENPLRKVDKFMVYLDDTPLLARPSADPEHAACRALVARGYPDGPVAFRHEFSSRASRASRGLRASLGTISMKFASFHRAAGYVIRESSSRGLVRVPYEPVEGKFIRPSSDTSQHENAAQRSTCSAQLAF